MVCPQSSPPSSDQTSLVQPVMDLGKWLAEKLDWFRTMLFKRGHVQLILVFGGSGWLGTTSIVSPQGNAEILMWLGKQGVPLANWASTKP